MISIAFLVAAVVAIVFLSLMLYLALFEPGLPYIIDNAHFAPSDSEEFRRVLGALVDAQVHGNTEIQVLSNGEVYYEAELAAIRQARHSVNVEAYILQEGEVTRRFLAALVERARAGVRVKIVLDSVGSFSTRNSAFRELTEVGGRVCWYHPIRWYTLPRINNRTHRELIIVDGRLGFIGGSGFADWWLYDRPGKRRWRDTMFRVEGDAVCDLQATFVENWVESSGEILADKDYFPRSSSKGTAAALVVDSSPTTGLSTRARMLFQTLIACARQSLCITTPYFLPDRSARGEIIRAIRERGVKVKVITPGRKTDQRLTRRSSRRLYGPLLEAGAEIYEYGPAMIHTKTLIVDGIWSVVGSTNFDNRSFGLNDEVNLAVCDAGLARRLLEDFALDLSQSRAISHREWRRRPLLERSQEWLGWLLERQQ